MKNSWLFNLSHSCPAGQCSYTQEIQWLTSAEQALSGSTHAEPGLTPRPVLPLHATKIQGRHAI